MAALSFFFLLVPPFHPDLFSQWDAPDLVLGPVLQSTLASSVISLHSLALNIIHMVMTLKYISLAQNLLLNSKLKAPTTYSTNLTYSNLNFIKQLPYTHLKTILPEPFFISADDKLIIQVKNQP